MNYHRNNLDKAGSPYLRQHASNPVYWQIWNRETLEEARRRDQLILLSIGYATCHWCHVMEHESFSDPDVAEVMNNHFICIKVDREELPDVDAYYMDAVQAMGVAGGWPLNVILLPDGRPVFGGTYFPRNRWLRLLQDISEMWHTDKSRFAEYATRLTDALRQAGPAGWTEQPEGLSAEEAEKNLQAWFDQFDRFYGGHQRAPKFPLPVVWNFLLDFSILKSRPDVADHVHFTLQKMAYGGLFDQVEGGFFRYSTDVAWHIPHFEKMLYDNAQLVGLYARAHRHKPLPLYRHIVKVTTFWLEKRLLLPAGLFASGLDADSEGLEGRYYVYSDDEIQRFLHESYQGAREALGLLPSLKWEGYYHVFLKHKFETPDGQPPGEEEALWLSLLAKARENKILPARDYKALLGWNALLVSAWVEASWAFPEENYLDKAVALARSLRQSLLKDSEKPLRCHYDDGSSLSACSDDMAHTIAAWIRLGAATGEDIYWNEAAAFLEKTFESFYNPKAGFFMLSAQNESLLPDAVFETEDSVIPSSNAVMAGNLMYLGMVFGRNEWIETAQDMLRRIRKMAWRHPRAHSLWWHWLSLMPQGPSMAVCTSANETTWQEVAACLLPGVMPARVSVPNALDFFASKFQHTMHGKLWQRCHLRACLPPAASFCSLELSF